MHDGSKLALLFPLEIMCFSDLLSSRKNRGWPEPDQRWESFTAWCTAQVSLSKPLLASLVLSHGSQERAQHTLLTLVLRRQIFRADADQRTTEDRSGTLHVCTPHICIWLGEPFPSRCSPSCLIASTYPRKTDYSHFSLLPAPSFPVLTLENRWATALPRSTFCFLCCLVTIKMAQRQEGFWNFVLQYAK